MLNDGVNGTGAARFIGDILQPISTTFMPSITHGSWALNIGVK